VKFYKRKGSHWFFLSTSSICSRSLEYQGAFHHVIQKFNHNYFITSRNHHGDGSKHLFIFPLRRRPAVIQLCSSHGLLLRPFPLAGLRNDAGCNANANRASHHRNRDRHGCCSCREARSSPRLRAHVRPADIDGRVLAPHCVFMHRDIEAVHHVQDFYDGSSTCH
jgi:hypothetical protein